MRKEELVSKEYVFKKVKGDQLAFVGDFDVFYKNEDDPWGQKGSDVRLNEYYQYSRRNLLETLRTFTSSKTKVGILEVGCGLGYVADFLNKGLAGAQAAVTGMDISQTAVAKAKKVFPHLNFVAADIGEVDLKHKASYDVIIMSQILWYVLEKLPQIFRNFKRLIKPSGHVVFVNAFLREQKYGRNIVDGFDGLVRYVMTKHGTQFRLVSAKIDYSKEFIHDDGIAVFQKK
ncbi:MAG: class I SAM-dependent methyltransferase [Candidatus Omnitrophota bacterium]|nr:class I SAM-dependent methyltransferase [Candidatus Omnitrophota bacterium]